MIGPMVNAFAHGSPEPVSAEDVHRVRFTVSKFTDGYDQSEVDDFLDEVVATLRAREAGEPGTLSAAQVHDVTFSHTKFRAGYAVAEVDDFLDRVARTLARGAGHTPAAPSASPAPRAAADAVAAGTPDPTATPGLIPPARGWRRLFGR